ncbi:hypothetical protein B0T24DRAFT_601866 [Lasiosphaeria ovina]|uniref:Uncharacterized protein n=1 Tax=Lasiosphaeria ovina TaxID=92902 RepID=A0AAE0TWU0_9PEZI|nr:hypothetical protein B0T24DRAFT_601866 [Lasiosphaeria ovina]
MKPAARPGPLSLIPLPLSGTRILKRQTCHLFSVMLSSPARTLQIAVALLCSAARTHTVPSVKVPASAIGAGGWASLCPVRVPVRSGHLRAPTPASGQGMPRWPEGSSDGSARVGALSVQPEGQHFTRVGADENGVPQRAEDGRSWWMWQFSTAAGACPLHCCACCVEASWKVRVPHLQFQRCQRRSTALQGKWARSSGEKFCWLHFRAAKFEFLPSKVSGAEAAAARWSRIGAHRREI